MGTQEVVVKGEWWERNKFALHVVAVVLRFIVFLVLMLSVELELTIDTGEQTVTHIVYNQRITILHLSFTCLLLQHSYHHIYFNYFILCLIDILTLTA